MKHTESQREIPSIKSRTLVAAIAAICASSVTFQSAHAGVGWGDSFGPDGTPLRVPTFYANSPSGVYQATVVDDTGAEVATAGVSTSGEALRKFIDPLPLPRLSLPGDTPPDKYIPVAQAEKWVRPDGTTSGDDYYEIAVVEFAEQMHTDLAKPTTLRGYVQLSTTAKPGKHLALANPDGTAILMPDGSQAYAVDKPHYLGPIIVATKGVATRLKFYNLLPVGRYDATTGKRNGDLFIPVDSSLAGAGYGPDGIHLMSENRAEIHLHGGDSPWISDGTPHQWITPAGEADATNPKSLAAEIGDPVMAANFLRGPSARNVPDMPDPGPGAVTMYFPNEQTARLMFYHDHSFGLTRLNVYAGEAAGYVLTDTVESQLVASGAVPAAADTIPLILQDKGFVPDDIARQDAKWNVDMNGAAVTAWGAPGDLYFPHVYEINQDPMNGLDGTNPVGRWDWGPYFWPVFPALYNVPSGNYADASTTPEAFMDTPLVNGAAYPTLTVDPKAYRFRILNASNDRSFNLGLYVADPTVLTADNRTGTEVKMVAAVPAPIVYAPCAVDAAGVETVPTALAPCWPADWPTDGREGGVPDPATVGPEFIQIATEGGFLPHPARIPVMPMGYEFNRKSITVLNPFTFGLYIGNAERADVVVDFSAYAGKTLILYNDAPAPVPAFDPRLDYYTDGPDQSTAGGAEMTRAGYGPNTRTVMQIKVADVAPAAAFDMAKLETELPKAYGGYGVAANAQARPVVAESAYNTAFGTAWADRYASIFTGTLQVPTFTYLPGEGAAFSSVVVATGGTGFTTVPNVVITDAAGPGAGAVATATMRISKVNITNAGSGYTVAPAVTITDTAGGGTGATAYSTLKVLRVAISNGGSGYSAATPPLVTFSMPTAHVTTGTGVRAAGTAVVVGGRVTAVTVTNAGSGYFSAPTVTIAAPVTGTRAVATTVAGIGAVTLTAPNPNLPDTAGGNGFTNMATVQVNFVPAPPAGGVAATATVTGSVASVTLNQPGSGYVQPTIAFQGGGGTGATAAASSQGSMVVKNKAIQELFDPTFGRMNATLGVEMPFTSAMTQTTIPLGYVDPTTEEIADGETQIWKITHNGVDTHPVHFHLYNVQVVNRVGWDGTVKPPLANELGWKETVKMHPLEDIVVAIRAKKPKLPGFGLPLSERPMDPTQELGVPTGFTQINALTGMPATVVNEVVNYGWEYVWHCHILGHEENDFMRPVKFNANEVIPAAPTGLARAGTSLTWADNATTEYKYTVEAARNAASAYTLVSTNLANTASQTVPLTNASGQTYYLYRVTAVGAAGTSSAVLDQTPVVPPTAPNQLQATAVNNPVHSVRLQWSDRSNNETGFLIQYRVRGGTVRNPVWGAWVTYNPPLSVGANAQSLTFALPATGTYQLQIAATNSGGNSAWVGPAQVTVN